MKAKTTTNKKTMKKAINTVVEENIIVDKPFELDYKGIIFDGKVRKMLVEGVLQDIKGCIESKTNGLVEVIYEDYSLADHEFGFKLYAQKSANCKRQMFYEATAAIVSMVNYMLQGGNEQYDVAVSTEDNKLEVEFVSNW